MDKDMKSEATGSKRREFLSQLTAAGIATGAASALPYAADAAESADRKVKLDYYFYSQSYNPLDYEICMDLVKNMRTLGVDVNAQPRPDWVSLFSAMDQPWNYDMATGGYGGTPPRLDPDVLLYGTLSGSLANQRGSYNVMGYRSKEVTALLEDQRRTLDLKKRRALWYKIQELAASDNCMFPLMHYKDIWAYNKGKFKDYKFMIGAGAHNIFSLTAIEPTGSDKTLVGAYKEAITHVNPMNITSMTDFAFVWWLIYDPLMQIGLDAKPVNWLASDVKVVDDLTTVITLRKGVKFHDGRPLTADDVKFTYDYHLQWKVPQIYPFVEPLAKVEKLDDSRVKFTFKRPYAPQMTATFVLVGILPKHDWEGVLQKEGITNPAQRKNIPAIGSGPFQFVDLEPRQQLVLKRNPNHWAAPKVERYVEAFYNTQDAIVLALASGEAHFNWGYGLTPSDTPKIAQNKDLATAVLPAQRLTWVALNLRRLPGSDLAFRQAFSHVFNHEHYVKDIYGGYGEPQASLVPPGIVFWSDPKKPFYHKFDLAGAREILKNAGYTWDGEQLLYPKNVSDKTKLSTTML
ncbi:MAG: ABC transporter substrate-binding protein [Vulcanimicrobiaceae bacterium]